MNVVGIRTGRKCSGGTAEVLGGGKMQERSLSFWRRRGLGDLPDSDEPDTPRREMDSSGARGGVRPRYPARERFTRGAQEVP